MTLQSTAKAWYASKTIWLAILQGLLAVVLVIGQANPELGALILAKTFLDILIRYVTNGEIIR